METITTTVALYENVQFGYRALVSTEMGERWEKDREYVRVSEIATVTLPLIAVNKDAAKAAALEAKRTALTQQLWDIEAEQQALLEQQEAERQHTNERRLGHGFDHDDDSDHLTDDNTDYGDDDTGEDCNVETLTCAAELQADIVAGR